MIPLYFKFVSETGPPSRYTIHLVRTNLIKGACTSCKTNFSERGMSWIAFIPFQSLNNSSGPTWQLNTSLFIFGLGRTRPRHPLISFRHLSGYIPDSGAARRGGRWINRESCSNSQLVVEGVWVPNVLNVYSHLNWIG